MKEETTELNDIKVDGPLYWDGLSEIHSKLVTNIMEQQALVLELAKKFESVLTTNAEIGHSVNGLMLSIKDLATNVTDTATKHLDGSGVPLKGIAGNDDDILKYLAVASTYIAIEENLANLIATGYLDVFTRLTTAGEVNSEAAGEMQEINEGLKQGAE